MTNQFENADTNARQYVANRYRNDPTSAFAKAEETMKKLPHFDPNEVVQGRILGGGQFGTVRAVSRIELAGGGGSSGGGGGGFGSGSMKSRMTRGYNTPPNTAAESSADNDVDIDDNMSITSYKSRMGGTSFLLKHFRKSNVEEVGQGSRNDELLSTPATTTNVNPLYGRERANTNNYPAPGPVDQTREFMADNYAGGPINGSGGTSGGGRYAVKYMRGSTEETDNRTAMFKAAIDFVQEVYMLSVLSHRNIIKLRGIADGRSGLVVIMDRLYETLDKKVLSWRKKSKMTLLNPKGRKQRKIDFERYVAASDLAGALKYLHSVKVVHRDLKPENIGFDSTGCLKIFDFGLAVELRPSKLAEGTHDMYLMTANTGSMRFMAPEVYLEKPYNEAADIYSYGMVLYTILALVWPFDTYFDMDAFPKEVFVEGDRPPINPKWPKNVGKLLHRCWSPNVRERPYAKECWGVVGMEMTRLRDHIRRSSI